MARNDRNKLDPAAATGPTARAVLTVLIGLSLSVATPAAVSASGQLTTATGLRVTIHTHEDITERWLVHRDGRTYLQHPTAGTVELDTQEQPWAQLVPAPASVVTAALAAMHGFTTDVAVDVFLLPGFPADVRSSFARRHAIFLAPGLGEQAAASIAYVVTHEMGHVLDWAALSGRPDRWDAYRALRNLDPQPDPAQVPHADRHREILAEDLRYLFGGPLATRSGTIENGRIPLPDTIEGLRELLAGFLNDPRGGMALTAPSRVFPNPCRDLARIELEIGDIADKRLDDPLRLEIIDMRGRLIRRLEDGTLANGRVVVTWDGQTADGRRAAAGQYLYRITGGGRTGTGKLLLVDR
jgi:hypothetical protein